jgi:anaerobic selenocysteine-containing dehydrogenase
MASRRDFLKMGAAGAVAPLAAALVSTQAPARRYGVLSVDGHTAHKQSTGETLHVRLDGVDVTKQCYEACDGPEGYVKVYCRDQEHHKSLDAKGARHVDPHSHAGACRLMVRGTVTITPGPEL